MRLLLAGRLVYAVASLILDELCNHVFICPISRIRHQWLVNAQTLELMMRMLWRPAIKMDILKAICLVLSELDIINRL